MLVFLVLLKLAHAAPFLTTWNTTQPNEAIELPQLKSQAGVAVDWGDSTTGVISGFDLRPSHTYATPGLHNVSIDGQFFWTGSAATREKLVEISSWGDGFLVDSTSLYLFSSYLNLHVSAPPNTQPVFLPGASLQYMFHNSSFNSPLDWDLTNATSLFRMFSDAFLVNQPITFRNTQGVTTINAMFYRAVQFNQPFHLDDASGLIDASGAFSGATSFNQIVNLSNSHQLTSVSYMFWSATAFNQPLFLNTDSVTTMEGMFFQATSFNQPVNFNTSQVTTMNYMFENATSFNQPINFFHSPNLNSTEGMFNYAASFNQPVVMDTANVTTMARMFLACGSFASTVNFTSVSKVTTMNLMFYRSPNFTQDLSSWNVSAVAECTLFCPYCGLPSFGACTPCQGGGPYNNGQGVSVCSTRSPTTASPTIAPSTPAPTIAPSTAAPSNAAPSMSLSTAPSAAPSVAVVQSAASPSEGFPDWLVIFIVSLWASYA